MNWPSVNAGLPNGTYTIESVLYPNVIMKIPLFAGGWTIPIGQYQTSGTMDGTVELIIENYGGNMFEIHSPKVIVPNTDPSYLHFYAETNQLNITYQTGNIRMKFGIIPLINGNYIIEVLAKPGTYIAIVAPDVNAQNPNGGQYNVVDTISPNCYFKLNLLPS